MRPVQSNLRPRHFTDTSVICVLCAEPGSLWKFRRDSAWWAFDAVNNFAEKSYVHMMVDVKVNPFTADPSALLHCSPYSPWLALPRLLGVRLQERQDEYETSLFEKQVTIERVSRHH